MGEVHPVVDRDEDHVHEHDQEDELQNRASMRLGRRPSLEQAGAPGHLDLEPLDLLARLGQAVLQVAAAVRGLERGHDLAEPGQLEAKQLLIAAAASGRSGASRRRLAFRSRVCSMEWRAA